MVEDKITEFEDLQKEAIDLLLEMKEDLNLNRRAINRNRSALIDVREEILQNSKMIETIKTEVNEFKIKLDHLNSPLIWTPFMVWGSPKKDDAWRELQDNIKSMKKKFIKEKEGEN